MDISNIKAYNVKLKKKNDKMSDPKGYYFMAKGKKRFMVMGKGSDGTKMSLLLGDSDAESLKKQGLSFSLLEKKSKGKKGGASRKRSSSKRSSHKRASHKRSSRKSRK